MRIFFQFTSFLVNYELDFFKIQSYINDVNKQSTSFINSHYLILCYIRIFWY